MFGQKENHEENAPGSGWLRITTLPVTDKTNPLGDHTAEVLGNTVEAVPNAAPRWYSRN